MPFEDFEINLFKRVLVQDKLQKDDYHRCLILNSQRDSLSRLVTHRKYYCEVKQTAKPTDYRGDMKKNLASVLGQTIVMILSEGLDPNEILGMAEDEVLEFLKRTR